MVMNFAVIFELVVTFNYVHGELSNVLMLLADDAGFEMGAYLNKFCQTPNLDALAHNGIIFNNAFSSVSSCSPSRAQLLTGQASHSNGMYGLHHSIHNFNVLPSVSALPNILRASNLNISNSILSGIVGKKHVGGDQNFKFDFEQTEENNSINQVGRNITNIKLYTREFLSKARNESRPFFLMIGFHDPHRCGHITPQYGEFCERWGSGEKGMGIIPDWKPIYYDWRNLEVPSYLPQTDTVKKELSAQYAAISRLDQGIGLVLKEIEGHGFSHNTLIIYTSDNGPPFPGGRTNLYDRGIHEPMIMSSPENGARRHEKTGVMASLLDIFPTILNVFKIKSTTRLAGKSLLPVLYTEPPPNKNDAIFGSQNFHEVTMNYPMRMVRSRRYKLIHNLNFWAYFPIDQDVYTSPTFQEILNTTIHTLPLPWFKCLKAYYKRTEWELFDLKSDPEERFNVVQKSKYKTIFNGLRSQLEHWQQITNDPWRCAPHGILEFEGIYKENQVCFTLGHETM